MKSSPVAAIRIAAAMAILTLLAASTSVLAGAVDEKPRLSVLFISSFGKNIPAQVAMEVGLDRSLGFNGGRHDVYFEFMDIPRLQEENFRSVFHGYLQDKYRGVDLDFVVAWADAAIDFIRANGVLFPAAHRVYVEASDKHELIGSLDAARETRLVVQNDYLNSLREVFRLERPKKIHVIATSRDSAAQERLRIFRNALREVEAPEVDVEYLLDQSLDQVATTLGSVPRTDAIAFYLLMFSDGKGANMTPYAAAQHLAATSAVPLYTFWESLMGSGVVGGYVLSQEMTGFHLGDTILALSRGEAAAQISSMRYIYDWRALQKWGISEKMLKDGAVLLNRPPDLLEEYRWHIVATVAVILMLSALSVFLIRALKLRNVAVQELDFQRLNLEKIVGVRTEELVKTNSQLTKALQEIKTLKGILPLCSFCKKIRSEQGEWEQVDLYIHKHSEADISHSICPDCMKEHYPEVYEQMAREGK